MNFRTKPIIDVGLIEKGDIVYLVTSQDESGRDDLTLITPDIMEARHEFEQEKQTSSYARLESAKVIGGNEADGWEFDDNVTIDSYFAEDEAE